MILRKSQLQLQLPLCVFLLAATLSIVATNAYRPRDLIQTPQPTSKTQGWGLAVHVRGGSDDPEKPKAKKSAVEEEDDDEEEEDEEEELWEDAREVLEDEDETDDETDEDEEESEEEEEDWTEVEIMGERVGVVDDFEDEEDFPDKPAEEDVQLSEVLAQQQEEEEENVVDDDDDFVDALQEGIDIDMVASSTIHTDDESSSANVDRMDLADAYDEELLPEEEEESLSPVLAMGDDEEDDNIQLASNGANISPGGGTEEESNAASGVSEQTSGTITDEMKQVLKKLHWRKREIQFMRPDIAAVLVHRNLQRPREGMPESYYIAGKKATSSLGTMVKRVVIPLCLGAVAVYAGTEVDWEECLDTARSNIPKRVPSPVKPEASVAPAHVAEESSAEESTEEIIDATTEGDEDQEESKSTHDDDHPHAHSLKPYSPPDDIELDQTWLDKVITAIENVIKGIISKEL